MFPDRWYHGRGRGGDEVRDGVRGPGRVCVCVCVCVEASGAAGEPEGVSGDPRPLMAVDMVWCGS